MAACGALFFIAPLAGWWLPMGASSHYDRIDSLFYIILGITGFFFFLTEALLVGFMYMYARRGPGQPVAKGPAVVGKMLQPVTGVLHNQHRIEMAWTVVPAAILLYIAVAQIDTWADVKYQQRMPRPGASDMPLAVRISARQFEWRVASPSYERVNEWMKGLVTDNIKNDYNSFSTVPQRDDVHVVNELHTFVGQPTVVYLTTRDVIHSFNLPNLRVKQDALPGKVIPVWFTPTLANTRLNQATNEYEFGINPTTGKYDSAYEFNIACAELCGWGHAQMVGKFYVHETRSDYLEWLKKADAVAHQHTAQAQ